MRVGVWGLWLRGGRPEQVSGGDFHAVRVPALRSHCMSLSPQTSWLPAVSHASSPAIDKRGSTGTMTQWLLTRGCSL